MKKKLLPLFLLIFIFLVSSFSVDALTPEELLARVSECGKIELATANEDGSVATVACYDTYEEAKKIMNETDNDNLILIEQGIIIDAKYAVVDYDVELSKTVNGYLNVYIDKNSNITNGYYLNGGFPDEAAMIEVDYSTKRVKMKVAGLVGWIDKYEGSLKLYDIVPLAWVKTPQSYTVTSSELIHNFPENVYGNKRNSSRTIDRKPSMLEVGTYYSYDGHYFYTTMKALLQDYQNDNYNQSINKENPYYNYYQYLSFRTKTNYSSENINQFLKRTASSDSKMLNTGDYFINAQNKYGVNAILMVAIGMNESAIGSSSIAKNNNNLFGLNAVDKTPGQSANYFSSVEDCIDTYAYSWLSYGFLQPGDSRFKGANLGNKSQGLNYRYASDPFWAEKAASYYYDLDKYFDFQDYNAYQIAVLNDNYNDTVYAMKIPGGDYVSKDYYQYRVKDSAVVVMGETQGPAVNGNTTWYQIMSDPTDYIGNSKSNPRVEYKWDNSYVYVSAAYFTKVNTPLQGVPSVTPTVPDSVPKEEPNEPQTEAPKTKAISDIVKEANYHYENGMISGITPGATVETIKKNLTVAGGEVTVTDSNGSQKTTGKIGTGDKVNISSGIMESLSVLIYGDSNGDGSIDKLDCAEILRQYYGYVKYDDIRKKSLDINKDGNIDKLDASQVLRHYYGYINIEQ